MLKKKILFQKTYDYYFNMKLSLEQNLLDIKSMESNQNIHNVLIESSKATHTLKINLCDFENVTDKVKDNIENLRDVNDIIGDFNSDALNNEDLEKELNDLQIAEDKNNKEKIKLHQEEEIKIVSSQENHGISRLFPNANKNKIIKNEINDNKNEIFNEKENFINENSFQEILEELNKK